MHVVLYDNKQEVPTEQRTEMAAIHTYEARAIRTGFHAHKGPHHGTVLSLLPDPPPGTVSFRVSCDYCDQVESWRGIPAHSAVHAERAL